MSARDLVSKTDARFDQSVTHLQDELRSLRTGRAQTSLVENLMVEQFGQQMPLKAVANINTPDAHTIAISPWDKNLVAPIEKMIRESQSLGLNPSSDGNTVRLNVPPMTEERRREIVKELGNKVEQCHISMRNIRHEVLNEIKKLEKNKEATQDDVRWSEGELNKKIDIYRKKVEEVASAKEAEIMQV
jgi:ribosome recycling factor